MPDWSVYWEPSVSEQADWSNWAGTETEDEGIVATLEAEYTVPVVDPNTNTRSQVTRFYKHDFNVKTRELKPLAPPATPMEGSDVAMLEAMLWQLGMSPNEEKKPGVTATRLDASKRNKMEDKAPSVARMVGRFNYTLAMLHLERFMGCKARLKKRP